MLKFPWHAVSQMIAYPLSMCGRIALYDIPRVRRALRLVLSESFEPLPASPRFNVCPGTLVTAVCHLPLFPLGVRQAALLDTCGRLYEWLMLPDGKHSHFIIHADHEGLWLAGIWTHRADDNPGCAILTEPVRGCAAEIHDRMPLGLDDAILEPWLDSGLTDREALRHTVRHLDDYPLTHWPVSRRINRPGNDDASLIEPTDGAAG